MVVVELQGTTTAVEKREREREQKKENQQDAPHGSTVKWFVSLILCCVLLNQRI